MKTMSGAMPSSPEHSPVRFGDSGEFEFDSVVEQFDSSGERIVETALFFRHGDVVRGLTIVLTGAAESAEEAGDTPEPIELPFIDPESVLEIMELPSETLIHVSRPLEKPPIPSGSEN